MTDTKEVERLTKEMVEIINGMLDRQQALYEAQKKLCYALIDLIDLAVHEKTSWMY